MKIPVTIITLISYYFININNVSNVLCSTAFISSETRAKQLLIRLSTMLEFHVLILRVIIWYCALPHYRFGDE